MDNKRTKGQWAGCSDLKMRIAELQEAHKHFQQMVVSGEIKLDVPVIRSKRERVKIEKFRTITIWGKEMKVSIEEYRTHYLKAGF